ncbi:hypothetical protein KJ662_05650 [Patescibacteria group bacterium]|nr:hypothetical protein [Patescibacteria group bacterium]
MKIDEVKNVLMELRDSASHGVTIKQKEAAGIALQYIDLSESSALLIDALAELVLTNGPMDDTTVVTARKTVTNFSETRKGLFE